MASRENCPQDLILVTNFWASEGIYPGSPSPAPIYRRQANIASYSLGVAGQRTHSSCLLAFMSASSAATRSRSSLLSASCCITFSISRSFSSSSSSSVNPRRTHRHDPISASNNISYCVKSLQTSQQVATATLCELTEIKLHARKVFYSDIYMAFKYRFNGHAMVL